MLTHHGNFEDFLQDRLIQETSEPAFSEMPFRFAEVAKVLLDVYVPRLQHSSSF